MSYSYPTLRARYPLPSGPSYAFYFSLKWWKGRTSFYLQDTISAGPSHVYGDEGAVEGRHVATTGPSIFLPARELEQKAYLMAEGASGLHMYSYMRKHLDVSDVRHEPALYAVL
jgi:hypothetical protein